MLKILIGIISGIISGMGMGGGTILITILTCFLNINQKVAQASNLIFFIPTAIVATIINIKHKKINFRIAIPIAALGAIGAIAGSSIATKMNAIILRKMFGIFLIILAIYESYCWYKNYIKRNNK